MISTKVSPEQFNKVLKAGIKIYPVSENFKWFIEVNRKGKITRFEKRVDYKELNETLNKTIIYYFNKLKK